MKTWLVMRHAKSDWSTEGQADHDRPLNARGKRDAPRMGTLLAELDLVPDAIVCSTAERAKTTAEAVAKGCDFSGEVRLDRRLYLADLPDYVEVLGQLGNAIGRVLTVTHNPGCESAIERITGTPITMPTAAIARVDLEIESWAEFDASSRGKLVEVWRPKEIGREGG